MNNPAFAQQFFPTGSVKLSPTTSNVRAQLPSQGSQVLIYNAGPNIAFVAFGESASITAQVPNSSTTTGGLTIPPNFTQVIYTRDLVKGAYAAAICESGSASVYLNCGNGT